MVPNEERGNNRKGGMYACCARISTEGERNGALELFRDRSVGFVRTGDGRLGSARFVWTRTAVDVCRFIRRCREGIGRARAWASSRKEGLRRGCEEVVCGGESGRRADHAMSERTCTGVVPRLCRHDATTGKTSAVTVARHQGRTEATAARSAVLSGARQSAPWPAVDFDILFFEALRVR